jgi:hypothetical protein
MLPNNLPIEVLVCINEVVMDNLRSIGANSQRLSQVFQVICWLFLLLLGIDLE